MPKYAWGQAVEDFVGFHDLILAPPQPLDNVLIADGVEVRDVDYVDTDNNEYRVLLRESGRWMIRESVVVRELRKAETLEFVLSDRMLEAKTC
jgi:hypothetical protein